MTRDSYFPGDTRGPQIPFTSIPYSNSYHALISVPCDTFSNPREKAILLLNDSSHSSEKWILQLPPSSTVVLDSYIAWAYKTLKPRVAGLNPFLREQSSKP